MSKTILQPYIPIEDGVIDIEAINPCKVSDDVVLSITFEQFCEKITVLMIRHCPNRRVAHLVRHGRTERVRNKNRIRLWQLEISRLEAVIS